MNYKDQATDYRPPYQAWVSIACGLASPLGAFIGSPAAATFERSREGAISFGIAFTLYMALPIASLVFGASGAFRSWWRGFPAGLSLWGIASGFAGWAIAEILSPTL